MQTYVQESGVDVNAADAGSHGNTPLMVACAPTEKIGVLEFLLKCKGLAMDAVNRRGMTGEISLNTTRFCKNQVLNTPMCAALHQAAWYGQEKAVELLLRAGAGLEIKTPAGLTARAIAQSMGHARTLSLIEKEEERRACPPVETPEELRARIKAQYCRAHENAASRRKASEPRPLPAPISPNPAPIRPAAPVFKTPSMAAPKTVQAPAPGAGTVPAAICSETEGAMARRCKHPPRWRPFGASMARARAERDDAALLPLSAACEADTRVAQGSCQILAPVLRSGGSRHGGVLSATGATIAGVQGRGGEVHTATATAKGCGEGESPQRGHSDLSKNSAADGVGQEGRDVEGWGGGEGGEYRDLSAAGSTLGAGRSTCVQDEEVLLGLCGARSDGSQRAGTGPAGASATFTSFFLTDYRTPRKVS